MIGPLGSPLGPEHVGPIRHDDLVPVPQVGVGREELIDLRADALALPVDGAAGFPAM